MGTHQEIKDPIQQEYIERSMDLKETYNSIARGWVDSHSSDVWWQEGTDKFISFLKNGDWVLDAGCGAGVKTEYLRNNGLKVIGLDFSEGLLKIAEEKNPETTFLLGDIRDDINTSKVFDGVFAQAVLLHIPKEEIADTIINITNHLKSGGALYIAIKEPLDDTVREETVVDDYYGKEYERVFYYYKKEEMTFLLEGLGFEVFYSESHKYTRTIWGQIIAIKK